MTVVVGMKKARRHAAAHSGQRDGGQSATPEFRCRLELLDCDLASNEFPWRELLLRGIAHD